MKNILKSSKIYIKNILKPHKIDMKIVFKIYKRDMKNIFSNYITILIIVGVSCLPALYAWFNIQAGWDPYSNTSGILVAVVNLDAGSAPLATDSKPKEPRINIGNDVIKKLKTNDSIGWTFVNETQAQEGVKTGKYYASLTISKDFSKDLLSIATHNNPIKAKLIYTVNEKRNAIAPKITGKGATALRGQITESFIETAGGTIFTYLNKLGNNLEKNKPELELLIDKMISIDDNMPAIGKSIDNAYESSVMFQKFMKNIQKDIPVISGSVDNTLDITKTSDEYIGKAKNPFKNVSPIIKSDLTLIKNTADIAESSLIQLQDSNPSNNSLIRATLVKVRNNYSEGIKKIDNVLNFNKLIDNFITGNVVDAFNNSLSRVRTEMVTQQTNVNSMINTIDTGNEVLTSDINAAINGANKTSGLMSNTIDNFNRDTDPVIDDTINNTINNASDITNNAGTMLQNIQGAMPLFNSILDQTNTQLDQGVNSLKEIKNKFPKIQQDMHSNSEKLKLLTSDEKLNELIKILKEDGKKKSDFLSNPIDLVENRVYPIPNYGSAMTPFYTTLAIWVGAYILVSLLSVHVRKFDDGTPINTNESFLGRYLLFVSVSIMQTLVTIAGNLLVLKTYTVSPIIMVLIGVYVSIVFVTIIYTLVSVFGHGGLAITMVTMVLQVSGSGGTFPIELLGDFFQYINPMMPFTYAIGGMREATAGIIPGVLIKDMLILAIYFVVSLFLGIFLKEKINKTTENFVKEFHKSGLTGN
ncbi:YhgE/Pip family protein [Clostridium sp.]|uniref:YhgE/Pip domain-containing protein n=1 Tax=Clostridium sp. TaxID=1506 RepID=UPI003D6D7E9A